MSKQKNSIRLWDKRNPDKIKEIKQRWLDNNPEKRLEAQRKYREKNKEKIALGKVLYYQKYPKRCYAKKLEYEHGKQQRTPKWLTKEQRKEIARFYENCPDGYEVDHIIPLRGKEISGLHVLWNLQYLTKTDNCKKNNRLFAEEL